MFSTTAIRYSLEIARDALELEVLFTRAGLPGQRHQTPPDASVAGCGWPESFEFQHSPGLALGRVPGHLPHRNRRRWQLVEQHHMFFLRSNRSARQNRLLLVSATGTWCAYNNWGGSNHYEGITGPDGNQFLAGCFPCSARLPRGFVVLPDEAPRAALAAPPGLR